MFKSALKTDELCPYPRILVTGRDEEEASLVAETFEKQGYEVILCESSQEALDLIRQSEKEGMPVQAAFLSLEMTGLDGFSTARLLRQHAFWGSVFVHSDHYLGRYDWESEEAGCDMFFLRNQIAEKSGEILDKLRAVSDQERSSAEDASRGYQELQSLKLVPSY